MRKFIFNIGYRDSYVSFRKYFYGIRLKNTKYWTLDYILKSLQGQEGLHERYNLGTYNENDFIEVVSLLKNIIDDKTIYEDFFIKKADSQIEFDLDTKLVFVSYVKNARLYTSKFILPDFSFVGGKVDKILNYQI